MLALYVSSEEVAQRICDGTELCFVQQNLTGTDPALGLWLATWTDAYELRKLTLSFARTPTTGVVQDAAMTTHHFLNLTGGVPDASWITADYTSVEAAFDTWWTSLKPNFPTTYKLSEYVWRADGPAFKPFGGSLSPTLRRVARSVAGTGVGEALPPQIAMSVTETTEAKYTAYNVEGVGTQLRNRWGRFYLPPTVVGNTSQGRIASALATIIADATQTLYNTCTAAGLIPVMYSPTTGHAFSVLEIHVDDIFDVIRSRRYVTPITRTPRTITQP